MYSEQSESPQRLSVNPVLESKLLELSKILSETGGKKVYGYLDADTADDERLSQLYELWYQDKDFIHSTYTDEPAERVPLSQNEEFKPIRNAVIREALNISEDRFTVEDEDEVAESDAEPTNIPLDESDSKKESCRGKYVFAVHTCQALARQKQRTL